MEQLTVKELLEAGIHYGHRASRWNPKMKPYIYGRRKLIHIVDIRETLRGLITAVKFLEKLVAQGKDVVFVGTKRQARASIQAAAESTGMHYVTERWIGGMLTNFNVIRSRVDRLLELEQQEETGEIDQYSKKEGAMLRRELAKIKRNLNGVRDMKRLPGALVIVDPHREHIALREARNMGIATVALADTDCDPDDVDVLIPGNDDAMRAIRIVLDRLVGALNSGVALRGTVTPTARPSEPKPQAGRPSAGKPKDEKKPAATGGRTPQAIEKKRERGPGKRRGKSGPQAEDRPAPKPEEAPDKQEGVASPPKPEDENPPTTPPQPKPEEVPAEEPKAEAEPAPEAEEAPKPEAEEKPEAEGDKATE